MDSRTIPTLESLIAVDIISFRKSTRDISFDVYLKLSEHNIAHVFSRTTGLDYKRLAQYAQRGITELYIHRNDYDAYKEFISKPAESIFKDPNTPQERKIATLLNMTEQNMSEIFTQFNIQEDTADTTQKLIKNYVDIMTRTPQTLAIILNLVSHGEYLYYHSIAVSIFSMFLARATGKFNQKLIELIGFSGFLHDIGCTQLPKNVICSPTELTEEQWNQMHSHAALGLKMIEKTSGIPDEVRYIIYQHHEQPDGNGYPNGLRGSAIYYPATIVSLADAFSALISARPFRPAYTVEQALKILEKAKGKHDIELVHLLASLFRDPSAASQQVA